MQTHLQGRDVIDFQEWTKDELDTLLDVAFSLKRDRALGRRHPLLEDKVLAMLFFFSSTRTRASFEAGMAQLGGHAMFIESKSTQIAHGDTPKEIGEILGRYTDGIAIRHCDFGVGNRYIRDVAAASRVPVLNMQCDVYHPHQALADVMTMIERFGDLRGRTVTVSWAYAKSYLKPLSVAQSLVLLLPRFGAHVRLVHPPEFPLMPEVYEQAKDNAHHGHGSLEVMDDFDAGFKGTQVVYAKSWGAMMTTTDEAEESRLVDKYADWITDARRMALADEEAVYMHPLPAERGVEVADEVIDGPQSAVYDQAENRLHAQKASMALTMG
ncbi:MAG TPA: ornithine carbamoyltransferase [Acidimicrobiales bacterium]|nr:ornithine carbamoyltransferase [Acidimicrobiales bacterium]